MNLKCLFYLNRTYTLYTYYKVTLIVQHKLFVAEMYCNAHWERTAIILYMYTNGKLIRHIMTCTRVLFHV